MKMKIYSLNLVIDTLSKRKKIYTDERVVYEDTHHVNWSPEGVTYPCMVCRAMHQSPLFVSIRAIRVPKTKSAVRRTAML